MSSLYVSSFHCILYLIQGLDGSLKASAALVEGTVLQGLEAYCLSRLSHVCFLTRWWRLQCWTASHPKRGCFYPSNCWVIQSPRTREREGVWDVVRRQEELLMLGRYLDFFRQVILLCTDRVGRYWHMGYGSLCWREIKVAHEILGPEGFLREDLIYVLYLCARSKWKLFWKESSVTGGFSAECHCPYLLWSLGPASFLWDLLEGLARSDRSLQMSPK